MTESAQTARNDLAFLKAVVDDQGPLPAILGAHLLAAGLAFGADLVLVWAIYAGQVDWPQSLMMFTWAPGVAAWLPVYLWLQARSRGAALGPSARVFGAAWAAMGLMTAATVALLVAAQVRTGESFMALWPPLAFVLYGGAWTVVAINRRRAWLWFVALGSFAAAVVCGALVNTPEVWLVMAAGLILFFAAPGAAIVRLAARKG